MTLEYPTGDMVWSLKVKDQGHRVTKWKKHIEGVRGGVAVASSSYKSRLSGP